MHICISTPLYVRIRTFVYAYLHLCICVSMPMCMRICTYVYGHIFLPLYMKIERVSAPLYMRIHAYVYAYLCFCICIYGRVSSPMYMNIGHVSEPYTRIRAIYISAPIYMNISMYMIYACIYPRTCICLYLCRSFMFVYHISTWIVYARICHYKYEHGYEICVYTHTRTHAHTHTITCKIRAILNNLQHPATPATHCNTADALRLTITCNIRANLLPSIPQKRRDLGARPPSASKIKKINSIVVRHAFEYVYLCTCVCMYIYIYVYVHT